MFFESPGFHAISFPKHCQVLPVEVERAPVTLLVGFKRADAPGAVAAAFVAEHGLAASYQAGRGGAHPSRTFPSAFPGLAPSSGSHP